MLTLRFVAAGGGAENNSIYQTFYVPEVEAVIAQYQSLQTHEEQQAFVAGRRAYVNERQLVRMWLSSPSWSINSPHSMVHLCYDGYI